MELLEDGERLRHPFESAGADDEQAAADIAVLEAVLEENCQGERVLVEKGACKDRRAADSIQQNADQCDSLELEQIAQFATSIASYEGTDAEADDGDARKQIVMFFVVRLSNHVNKGTRLNSQVDAVDEDQSEDRQHRGVELQG